MHPGAAARRENVREVFFVRIVNPVELRIVRLNLLVEEHPHPLPLRAVVVPAWAAEAGNPLPKPKPLEAQSEP